MLKLRYMILAIILISIIIRIVLAADNVFSSGFVNFPGPDSYYHADRMRAMMATFPGVPAGMSLWGADWLMIAVSWLFGGFILGVKTWEYFVVFVPPLLAGVIIFMVYIIGSRLFNKLAALLGAFLLAVLPGEFMNRTLLGVIDHHVIEVLITTLAATVVIVGITFKKMPTWGTAVMLAVSAGCMVAYRYIWLGATFLSAGDIPNITTGYSESYAQTLATTTEAVPLLYASDVNVIIHALLAVTGIVVAIKASGSWKRLLIVAWTAVMLAATVWQTRFDYYLIVPTSILSGYMLVLFYLKGNKRNFNIPQALAVMLVVVLTIISMVTYAGIYRSDLNAPSDDWNTALEWVSKNTPEAAVVLAWWDYGYWIRYRGERKAYVTPGVEGDRVPLVARAFISNDPDPIVPAGDYVMVCDDTAYNYTHVMALWADLNIYDVDLDNTLAVRLYENRPPPSYRLVYDGGVKVYEYAGGRLQ